MPSMLSLLYASEAYEFSGRGFDVETTAIIRQAFDQACKELRDTRVPTASVKEGIAERLIEIAAHGERNPEHMCEAALVSLGLKPNPFTVMSGVQQASQPHDPNSKPVFVGSG